MADPTSVTSVFLSASIPYLSPEKEDVYYNTMDSVAIREAVLGLTRVVLSRGDLVFGGHPAINPFVLQIAKELGRKEHVFIFQSDFFKNNMPKEVWELKNIQWTHAQPTRETSLAFMREKMLAFRPYSMGVFIGGMDGVEDEYTLFCKDCAGVPAYPIGSTGAAALRLLQNNPKTPALNDLLLNETAYVWLFEQLLNGQV